MLIGVATTNFFTLLIPLVQSGEQLIIIRMLTGLAGGFAVSAPFPIAAELMPAQHRRTYGAIYEIMLASSFTLLPMAGFMLADNPNGFRLIALPGGQVRDPWVNSASPLSQVCAQKTWEQNYEATYTVPSNPPPIIKLCALAEDYVGNESSNCRPRVRWAAHQEFTVAWDRPRNCM